MKEIKVKINEYFSRLIQNHKLKDDDDIFELGLVHSMFLIQLILFLEKEFGIEVEEEDFEIENYRTIDSIASFIDSKVAFEKSEIIC